MKINLICVGKLKEKYWVSAVQEYAKRLSRFATLNIIELDEKPTLEKEAQDIIAKLKGVVIVFDLKGKEITSEEFAEVFSNSLLNGKSEFSLVIGSSEGLSPLVKQKADITIRFGKVTYPHQLMRVIVCEQLYRAVTINNHLTYHK